MANYGDIISKSIETTKKYKWLWIYGLVIAGASSKSSGNFNFPSDSFKSTNPDTFNQLQQTPNPNEVLGAVTNAVSGWFSSVNPSTWSLLGLGILILIVSGIGVSWVLTSWANGALIAGLKMAHAGKDVTLKNTSPLGFSYVKKLIVLTLVSFVMVFAGVLVFLLATLLFGVILALLPKELVIVNVLGVIVGVAIGLFLLVNYILTTIYAQRYVVLENMSSWDAWIAGWKLSTKNFFPGFLMGIINVLLKTAVGCGTFIFLLIVLGLPGYIFLAPMIASERPIVSSIVAITIIIIVAMLVMFLLSAILTVFSASNWNLFFESINKNFEKGKKNDK